MKKKSRNEISQSQTRVSGVAPVRRSIAKAGLAKSGSGNKALLLLLASFITCNQLSTTPAITVTIHATTLDKKLYATVNRYVDDFSDLTILNIKSKLKSIENLRTDFLHDIQTSCPEEQIPYAELEHLLKKLDIGKVTEAIHCFKLILQKLPHDAAHLMKSNTKDPIVKRILGL